MLFRSNRNFAKLSQNWCIPLIGWMNGNSPIAQHCLGPGCRDGNVVARFPQRDVSVLIFLDIFVGCAIGQRVFEVPHLAIDFDVFHLKVGDRGLELRVPVDEPLALVDQPLIVEADEDFEDGF